MVSKKRGLRFVTPGRTTRSGPSEFEADVIGVSDTGSAVVQHPDGRRIFVAGAWPGERILVRIKELKSQYGIGTLVKVLTPSPSRIAPPCPYHGFSAGECGGCAWMFMDYQEQLSAKQQRVEQAIRRIQADAPVLPILPSPDPLGYRIRAQLKTDGTALGFVANAQRQLVDVQDCLVLTPTNRATLRELRETLPNPAWKPANRQDWTTLDIDESVSSESVSVNKRLPFQQANRAQNEAMQNWLAKHLASLSPASCVLELFAGSGNFTEVIARAGFSKITAVEVVPEAVSALAERGLAGVTPVSCDLFDEASFADLMRRQRDTEILVLDPPRDGLKCRTGLFDKKNRLREVLYISCDLATLCRDLQEFHTFGFVLCEVQPVDLFPQTPHVEILVRLTRGAVWP